MFKVVDTLNSLTEDIENAHSLNAFKSRLNRFLQERYKFNPSCYAPGRTRGFETQNQNASEEANLALLDVYIGISKAYYNDVDAKRDAKRLMAFDRNDLALGTKRERNTFLPIDANAVQ